MALPALVRRVVAKTAAYSIESRKDRSGTIFTNRGATGSVTFTLPPASRCTGFEYLFLVFADQSIVVASKVADTLVAFNDIAADSLAISTSSKKIGTCIRALCDGTNWFAHVVSADGVTGAIATIAT